MTSLKYLLDKIFSKKIGTHVTIEPSLLIEKLFAEI